MYMLCMNVNVELRWTAVNFSVKDTQIVMNFKFRLTALKFKHIVRQPQMLVKEAWMLMLKLGGLEY